MTEPETEAVYIPRVAVWELTLACNFNCVHCGSRAGRGRGKELSPEEALALCQDLADAGCTRVTLSGGEPLLRKDWPELARALTDRGVAVNMVSNGQLFSREVAETAKKAGLRNIAFSLDGLEESHTAFRRMPGNWAKIMENFAICREVKLPPAVITTVHRQNMAELPAIFALLQRECVPIWQLQLATPSGNMGDSRDLVLQPDDLLELIPLIAELRALPGPPRIDVGDNIGFFGGYERELRGDPSQPELPAFWGGCQAGMSVVGIESNGNIKGCLSLPSSMNNVDAFVEGNIRERRFKEIWNDPNAFAFNRQFKVDDLKGRCRTCDYAELCRGGCSWGAFAHTGSRFETSLCLQRVVEDSLRQEALSFEVVDEEASSLTTLEQAGKAAQEGRLDEAAELLDSCLRQTPDSIPALDMMGFVRFFQERYADAEVYCRRALALKGDHAYAHKGLGLCLARQGKIAEGLAELEEAIRLQPAWKDPHWDLMVVLSEQERFDEARAALSRALAQVPDAAEVFAPLQAALERQAQA